jgi:methionyl-tRNA formyltransferase
MTHEFYQDEKKLRVFISGQKYFGGLILREMLMNPLVNVVGVCCPLGDAHIGRVAALNGIQIVAAGSLNYDTMPENVCLGITAHSFDYIGKRTRYKARLGWIGYHPSLLPRHRGRSSIEWAIKMRDFVTGGTTFWLNSGIDRGDIIAQEVVWIDPKLFSMDVKKAAKQLWEGELQDVGVRLISKTVSDIIAGCVKSTPQDGRFSTFEPSLKINDIYRPDALMIAAHSTNTNTELAPNGT